MFKIPGKEYNIVGLFELIAAFFEKLYQLFFHGYKEDGTAKPRDDYKADVADA